MIEKHEAIKSLNPNAEFAIRDGVIEWITSPISDADIDAEMQRMQADYDSKQYQRDRAAAYPSLEEQADMQYWDAVNGTTAWVDAVAAVKAQYPKPS